MYNNENMKTEGQERPLPRPQSLGSHRYGSEDQLFDQNEVLSVITDSCSAMERSGSMRPVLVGHRIRALIARESRAVFWWRMVLFGMLIASTIVVTVFVYSFIRADELQDFQDRYFANAERIVESFHDSFERKLCAIDAMSTAITSYALGTNSSFPFVTLPNFVERGSDLRILADSLVVHYTPLVTDANRQAWEDYALANRFHIDDAFAQDQMYRDEQDKEYASLVQHRILLQQGETQYPSNYTTSSTGTLSSTPAIPLQDGTGYIPQIWDLSSQEEKTVTVTGTGPYLPLWQLSPVGDGKEAVLNFNFANSKMFRGILPIVQGTHEAVIGRANIPTPEEHDLLAANIAVSQYRQDVETFTTEPLAFLGFPVFDRFRVANDIDNDDDHFQLVGILAMTLSWRQYLTNVLSESSVGFICVVQNSYDQVFSYQIDGPNVTFLGEGDRHNPKYDHLEVSADINSYLEDRSSLRTRSYTTVKLNERYGKYNLHVYPSQTTIKVDLSDLPKVYTSIVAGILVATMLVFLLFARLVEQRQEKVMTRAIQSGTIVSSLFPEQVEDRLYSSSPTIPYTETEDDYNAEWKEGEAAEKRISDHHRSESSGIRSSTHLEEPKESNSRPFGSFTELRTSLGSSSHHPTNHSPPTRRPIADLFPETTILFADLAGFTSWSSDRRPDQVFELLETLYAAFDLIAGRRRVFKVETIGDCYLAVTGLPQPQEDHAVIMAKFARDCVVKMNDLVQHKLAEKLGSDTANLKLRVGLHSGSVTAGVLRGQKSRFQLFGDTVNTASRIESTSKPGRIQASQATADALVLRGKQDWLIPRAERVLAKGKGELITYWILVPKPSEADGATREEASTEFRAPSSHKFRPRGDPIDDYDDDDNDDGFNHGDDSSNDGNGREDS